MFPAAFDPTITASERLQTHTLDHASIGIGHNNFTLYNIRSLKRSELYLSYKTIWDFALTLVKSLIFILLIIVIYHLIFTLL